MRSPSSPQVSSLAAAEQARRTHEECIRELQVTGPRVIADIALADGVIRPVAHKLGRKPTFVTTSPPRGAVSTGRIEEIRNGSYDRAQVVALKATGWGATITVEVMVL